MRTRSFILWTLLLVLLDQGSKLVVYRWFLDVREEIIPGLIAFRPVFNDKYSFANALLYEHGGMDMGLVFHLFLFAGIWFMLFILYRFYKSVAPGCKLPDAAMVFLTAAVVCAYAGFLVWKEGVLDFLQVKPLKGIVCDLKDIYVNIFIILWNIGMVVISVRHGVRTKDLTDYLKTRFGGSAGRK